MRARILVVVLAFAIAAPVFAQQREVNQAVADQQHAAQKNQMRTYELVLRAAIDRGGQQFAAWAKKVAPEVMLAPVSPAMITSVPVPDRAVVFDIQIPEIIGTAFLTARAPQLQKPLGVPTQPIGSNGGASARVGAASVLTPDPMADDQCPNMTPDQCYSELIRLSLIDATLDGSNVLLTLKEDETLTVAAMGIDVANTNPLYANNSRKLILTIKGSDLLLYRQGKISRDEAKSRIVETRF